MSKEFQKAYGGEAGSVTAAHEAGHALVAWVSPAIKSVAGTVWTRESPEGGKVTVGFLHKEPATLYTIWEIAAISAAGMAAEVITHARFRTKSCRGDLKAMRTAAINLCRGGSLKPFSPWPASTLDAPVPPFERYFGEPTSARAVEVMRAVYLRAHETILAHRGAYERLRTALIAKIELTTAEVADALRMAKA